jgi:Ca-activated chloride channel family protein
VLLVTDGVSPAAKARIAAQSQDQPVVHIYSIGAGSDAVVPPDSPPAPALDPAGLAKTAAAGNGSLVVVTPDGRDVERLSRIVETEFTTAANPDSSVRWRDFGYWLTPLIAILTLLWFRPGWAIRWHAIVLILVLAPQAIDAQEPDQESRRFWFATRDQQAQRLYDQGAFAEAATLFTSPERQGAAWYRAGDFKQAAAAFGRSGTVAGLFNRGNCLVLLGDRGAAEPCLCHRARGAD